MFYQVAEKINISGEDHGLFLPAINPKDKPQWLKMERTLGMFWPLHEQGHHLTAEKTRMLLVSYIY